MRVRTGTAAAISPGMVQIETARLEAITGGGAVSAVARVGGRPFPLIDAGTSLFDGYQKYSKARADGQSVASSLGEGAAGAISSFTFFDLWGPSPAY
jgi:hypothetical protein